MIENPTLPEGWTSEDIGSGCQLISGNRGYTTIDWEHRGFRSGHSIRGPLTSTSKYVGRGWQQRLLADAVAWLEGRVRS